MAPLPRLSVYVACLNTVLLLCSAFSPTATKPCHRHHHHRILVQHSHALNRPRRAPIMARSTLAMRGEHHSVDSSERPQPRINAAISLLGKSTSSFVSLTFFAFLAVRRDAYMISFFIGAISNGILSKILKKILNHDRPKALDLSDHIKLKPSDGGMPSSHAMSLGFIGTYTALGVADSMPWLIALIVPYVFLSLSYRVKSSLHTVEQVAVGVVLGGEL